MRIHRLVILATAALVLIHCGGSGSGSGSGSGGGGSGSSTGGGGESKCPAERPSGAVGICDVRDLTCHYEGGEPCTREWICALVSFDTNGLEWRENLDSLQDQPCLEVGATCSNFTKVAGDCCFTFFETVCTTAKTWDLVVFENDNPSDCPAAVPVAGAPCDGITHSVDCIYPVNEACGSTKATGYCKDGVWKVVAVPCGP